MFIYIPLCLYLYDISTPPVNSYYTIYIPLCLYLYLIFRNCCIHRFAFTFHYASTYTRDIPPITAQMTHLHSTMPLLIRTPTPPYHQGDLIYIPLCSTYTKLLLKMYITTNIYIPLCLYLYKCYYFNKKEVSAIYIPLCLYLYTSCLPICFHRHFHLHSTMPLLIP